MRKILDVVYALLFPLAKLGTYLLLASKNVALRPLCLLTKGGIVDEINEASKPIYVLCLYLVYDILTSL